MPQVGVRGANQFENYMNSLRGSGGGRSAGGSGAGVPYYQANRAYDREFGRIYRPNQETDKRFDFDESQGNVTDLYFKYLREKDPKKRAELFRDYNRARTRSDKELGGRRSTAPRVGTGAKGRLTKPGDRTAGRLPWVPLRPWAA